MGDYAIGMEDLAHCVWYHSMGWGFWVVEGWRNQAEN